jgi:hypothetical protein
LRLPLLTRNTIDVIGSHIETVRAAMKAVGPERAKIAAADPHIEKGSFRLRS